jgi:hypothetical protein
MNLHSSFQIYEFWESFGSSLRRIARLPGALFGKEFYLNLL